LTARPLKTRYLAELGLDLVWFLPFTRELASVPAVSFVRDLLLPGVRPREIWIGHDFRFGHDRQGDFDLLRAEGARYGFAVHRFDPVREGGRILSSSLVRDALRRGAIAEAEEILGHSVVLEGPVGYGRGQGGKLLVATANLDLPPEQFLPARGVYAAQAEIGGNLQPCVLNVGVRPTLTSGEATVVEAHLIRWSGDLRGRWLTLHLGTMMRNERKFGSLDELRTQVGEDVRAADAWLRDWSGPRRCALPEPRDAATETND
jgi:riboflavin kinase/FMN adenylyltransferase